MTIASEAQPPAQQSGPAIVGLVVVAFFWGSMVPVITWLFTSFDPFLMTVLRCLAAQPALLLAALLLEQQWPYGGKLPWRRIVPLGTVGMAGFATLQTLGIMLSNPISAAVVLNFGPLTAALVARVLDGIRFPRGLGLAIVLAVAGGILVVTSNSQTNAHAGFRGGELLLIVSQVCWTWYSMKAQAWLAHEGMSQLQITTVTSAVALMTLGAVYALVASAGMVVVPMAWPPAAHIGMVLWIGIGGSGLALVLWNESVSRLGVVIATLYLNLVPVFAVLIAAAFGTPVSVQQIMGGLLVILGVAQMQARQFVRVDT
jgi:drug/metabolite transporter (DMT)-like permease